MKEFLDIWTEDGVPTGKIALKEEAHNRGWFHPTVHIWMYTSAGAVLLQQRGAHKETFPSYWDVSVAGHVMAGENIIDGALREVAEAIGLKIGPRELTQIDVRKNINKHPNGIIDCEFQHVFLCELTADINDLIIQEEEVDGVALISLDKLLFYTHNRNESFQLVPADYSYYTFIVEQVTKILNT